MLRKYDINTMCQCAMYCILHSLALQTQIYQCAQCVCILVVRGAENMCLNNKWQCLEERDIAYEKWHFNNFVLGSAISHPSYNAFRPKKKGKQCLDLAPKNMKSLPLKNSYSVTTRIRSIIQYSISEFTYKNQSLVGTHLPKWKFKCRWKNVLSPACAKQYVLHSINRASSMAPGLAKEFIFNLASLLPQLNFN